MLEDIEASYPDSGSVIDSKEGGPEESEEVEDRQVKEARFQILMGHPSLNIWAKSLAPAGVLPLDGDPFGNIKS